MTQQEVRNNVKNALLGFSDIFDCSEPFLHAYQPIESSNGNNKYITFYFPKKVNLEEVDGFKLLNDKGFISIQEKYIKNQNSKKLERVSYIYKYITNEVSYVCTHLSSSKEVKIPYKFHYDMDQNHNNQAHPTTHLQVLHSHPRFKIEGGITVSEFVKRIKSTCFKNETGKPDPYIEAIFDL